MKKMPIAFGHTASLWYCVYICVKPHQNTQVNAFFMNLYHFFHTNLGLCWTISLRYKLVNFSEYLQSIFVFCSELKSKMRAFVLLSCLAIAAARPEAGYSYNRPSGGHSGGGGHGGGSIGGGHIGGGSIGGGHSGGFGGGISSGGFSGGSSFSSGSGVSSGFSSGGSFGGSGFGGGV